MQSEAVPCGRYEHGVGVVGATLFIFGGTSSKRSPVVDKVTSLNLRDWYWHSKPLFTQVPHAELAWKKHSAHCQIGRSLWIVGGNNIPAVSHVNLHELESDWIGIGAPSRLFLSCETSMVSPDRRKYYLPPESEGIDTVPWTNLVVYGQLGAAAPVKRIFNEAGLGMRMSSLPVSPNASISKQPPAHDSSGTSHEWLSRLSSLGNSKREFPEQGGSASQSLSPHVMSPALTPVAQRDNESRAAAIFFQSPSFLRLSGNSPKPNWHTSNAKPAPLL